MFPEWVSEIGTVVVQAFMITVIGWIVVFAWQDIGGVENFKRIIRLIVNRRKKIKKEPAVTGEQKII